MLLAGLIATGMFGITYLGSGDVPFYSPVFLGCVACAIVLGFLFVRHSRTDAAPFVPYRLLRGRGFGIMNLINYLYGAAALGFAALVPLYAQRPVRDRAARRGDAADRAGGRDDRGRRGGRDGAAPHRVPAGR